MTHNGTGKRGALPLSASFTVSPSIRMSPPVGS
jgi:hypothetical protein